MKEKFEKNTDEPQLDMADAKRILEYVLYECGMDPLDDRFEDIVERVNQRLEGTTLRSVDFLDDMD